MNKNTNLPSIAGYQTTSFTDHSRRQGIHDDDFSNVTEKLLPKKKHKNRLLGGVTILIIVAAWIAMAEDLQAIQQGQRVSSKPYDKPFFQSYIIHSSYSMTILVWAIWYFCFTVRRNPEQLKQQITLKILGIALIFSALTFISAYTWYQSLPVTTVSSNTAIYQSSCIFIFIFSIFMLKDENISLGKIISVLVCVVGVILVSFFGIGQTENGHTTTTMGYIWVLISMIIYSFTETLYGRLLNHGDDIDASFNFLFLGLIGLFTFFLYWPGLIILHYTGIEIWELPTGAVLYSLLINVFLDAIFNAGFFVGIYLTSPLFMAVGSLLTIPVSVVVDKILNDYVLPIYAFIGMAAIVIGFLGLNLSELLADKVNKNTYHYVESSKLRQLMEFFVVDIREFCKENKRIEGSVSRFYIKKQQSSVND